MNEKAACKLFCLVLLFVVPISPAFSLAADLVSQPSDAANAMGFLVFVALPVWAYVCFLIGRKLYVSSK